ncbi:MAG: 50S ribosomal protein L11 methyltransferase [Candidatus Dormiibacterota bacterium]
MVHASMVHAGNRPAISSEVAERIREWHEAAARATRRDSGSEQTFAYLGKQLTVPPGVHQITGVSHLLGEAVIAEVGDAERVLDVGTGSGVNAILAASRGGHVVAVDVIPQALDAARHNAERSGMSGRIDVLESDHFGGVVGQFDVIIFEPQVRLGAPNDRFTFDGVIDDVEHITGFIHDARRHLTRESGRILFFAGPSPGHTRLIQLANEERFTASVVAQEAFIRDGQSVDYFVIRVTPF